MVTHTYDVVRELLRELGVPHRVSVGRAAYAAGLAEADVTTGLARMRRQQQQQQQQQHGLRATSFRELGVSVLGQQQYARFVDAVGFSDFEAYDAGTALRHYGFDDTHGAHKYFSFSWRRLVEALSAGLDIRTRTRADLITSLGEEGGTAVRTRDGATFVARSAVVVGTPVGELRRLLRGRAPAGRAPPRRSRRSGRSRSCARTPSSTCACRASRPTAPASSWAARFRRSSRPTSPSGCT
jgi:hypothetical protein